MTLPEARALVGLSRAELARRADVSDDSLYDIETGRNQKPAWVLVGNITRALRDAGLKTITPEDLFPLSAPSESGGVR